MSDIVEEMECKRVVLPNDTWIQFTDTDREKLIQEVERLTKQNKMVYDELYSRNKKIDSLTTKLKLQEQDNERIIQSSKGAVDRMKAENASLTTELDGLKEEIRISQGIKYGRYTAPKEGWTCFHCGVTFTKPGAASDHFGEVSRSKAKCQYHDLDVEKLEAENKEIKEVNDKYVLKVLDMESENAELEKDKKRLGDKYYEADSRITSLQRELATSEKSMWSLNCLCKNVAIQWSTSKEPQCGRCKTKLIKRIGGKMYKFTLDELVRISITGIR